MSVRGAGEGDLECGACGLPEISGRELDFAGYNDAASATKGHLKLCRKWARVTSTTEPEAR